jgi:UDP-N-acetylglucosamine:LPS N-acetylglucosamine transferase
MSRQKKICLVSSIGGHLHELTKATHGIEGEIYWVTSQNLTTKELLKGTKHYFIIDPFKTKWKYAINAVQSLWHLLKERPDVIISAGAGMAIPTLYFGKKFFGCKIIYIESAASVKEMSESGRFIYKHADLFLIQWEEMRKYYPTAIYTGLL